MAHEEAMGAFESNHFPVCGYSNYSRQDAVAGEVRPMDRLGRVKQNTRDESTGPPCGSIGTSRYSALAMKGYTN